MVAPEPTTCLSTSAAARNNLAEERRYPIECTISVLRLHGEGVSPHAFVGTFMASRPPVLWRAGVSAGVVLLFSWLAGCGTGAGGDATVNPTQFVSGGSSDASGDASADR
jgi:hypothetical protein